MSIRNSLPCYIESRLPDGQGGEQVLLYELLDELGSGGMGTVYRAKHLNPPESYKKKHGDEPRIVAVKYLHRHVMQYSDEALKRFVREAIMLQSVRHPNVVRIHSLGIDQEGIPFLAMELVENAQSLSTLRDIHAYRRQTSDKAAGKIVGSLIPLAELIPILRQFLLALREVHNKGIVHRDIKPDNVLITKDSTVKLTDFGISKSLDLDKDPALTMQGRIVGTPYYVSPEAVSGCWVDPRGKNWYVGPRSDIWALGIMCYELMSGRQAFDAEVDELPQTGGPRHSQTQAQLLASLILGRVVSDSYHPKPLAELLVDPNPIMVTLVEACMCKGPWDRPASCDVLLEVLDQVEEYEAKKGSVQPDQNKAKALLTMSASSEMPFAPTQLDSVPPRSQSSAAGQIAINVKGEAGAQISPAPQTTKRHVSSFWILAPLMFSAVCGVIVWWVLTQPESPLSMVQTNSDNPRSVATALPRTEPPAPSSNTVAKLRPDPGPAPGSRAYSVYQNGASSARSGDCRHAVSQMNAILAAHPDFPKPYRILGDCARKSGDLPDARKNYRKYLGYEGVEPLPPEASKIME